MKKIIPFAIIGLMSSFAAFAQSGESLQTPALNQEQALSSPVNKTLFTADSIRWKQARKAPWFVERFRLSAGFFTAVNNTNIKLGNNSGSIGTDIDFENDLGFNRQIQTFMADFQWRISRRSRVNFSYYALNRSSSYSLQKTIKFGDSTFNLNANVKGIFNNTIYRISWGYAIIAKPTAELGLLIGTHVLKTDIGLSASVNGVSGSTGERFTTTAPLPDLGLWGGFELSKRFALHGEFDYLSVAVGDVSAEIVGYNANLLFKVTKGFDLALGYTGFNFAVDAKTNNDNAHIGWGYNGPSLAASFTFGKKSWVH